MTPELEEKLWLIGQQEQACSDADWQAIIDDLLDDFETFVGERFQRDSELFIGRTGASTTVACWLWKTSAKGATDVVWSAVLSRGLCAGEDDKDVIAVTLSAFLFHAQTGERLQNRDGASILDFEFRRREGAAGVWECRGWVVDEWQEWEDVECPTTVGDQ